MRKTVLLKDNWQFRKADSRKWTQVRVPHDFAIRENFDRNSDMSFSIREIRGKKTLVERPGNTGGLPFCGKFIYQKEIEIESLGKDEMARLEFDGVMSHAEVSCNGVRVGGNSYGYSPFACNLTGVLKKGKNKITVEGENYHYMSRWYPGGGIFRDVRLVIFNQTHILRNGGTDALGFLMFHLDVGDGIGVHGDSDGHLVHTGGGGAVGTRVKDAGLIGGSGFAGGG